MINVITFLNEKILKQSVVGKKVAEKEVLESRKNFNRFLDKTTDMKNTKLRVEYVFGVALSKDFLSPEQISKLNIYLANLR